MFFSRRAHSCGHARALCGAPCEVTEHHPLRLHAVRSRAARPALFFFFFNDTAPTEISPLSLHDALPISSFEFAGSGVVTESLQLALLTQARAGAIRSEEHTSELQSHSFISYAVFCL